MENTTGRSLSLLKDRIRNFYNSVNRIFKAPTKKMWDGKGFQPVKQSKNYEIPLESLGNTFKNIE